MYLGHLDKGNPTQLEVGHLGSHTNRVFCIKWHPNDVNTFFSGGWDRTIFQWDVRTKTAVKHLFGYHIGGKSIDVKGS
jgi:WD40 repeat protein